MSAVDASVSMQTAVREYFSGEHREMLFIFAGSALLTALAAWLWIATRASFSLAFLMTVLVAAALMSGTAISLLIRDKVISSALDQGIGSPRRDSVVAMERGRIDTVISKYRYYRYGAAALAALSVLGLLLGHRGWLHGVAAGLLLFVVAQVVIDHFSEARAWRYLDHLSANSLTAPAESN